MVEVNCSCGTRFRLADEWVGKQGKCPRCGSTLHIEAVPEEPRLDFAPSTVLSPSPAPSVPERLTAATHNTQSGKLRSRSIKIAVVTSVTVLSISIVVGAVLTWWRSEQVSSRNHNSGPKAVHALEEEEVTRLAHSVVEPIVDGNPSSPTSQSNTADIAESSGATATSKEVPTPPSEKKETGLSGISRQYDDFHCGRIQQQFGLRIPPATILEVDGQRLPVANLADLQKSPSPFLLLPQGLHSVRCSLDEPPIRVEIADDTQRTFEEMKTFFHTGGPVRTEELMSRGARAMDVHRSPFLLNFMGASYFEKKEWAAAERLFRRALRVNPAFSPAHLNLANCLTRRWDTDGAKREIRLAEAFNIGDVFGLSTAIANARAAAGLPPTDRQSVELDLNNYLSSETMNSEDERLVALLLGLSKYAVRDEERGKVLNNLAVHFADSGRPELALDHFRSALDVLKFAGPERFNLARRIFAHMESTCRKARFAEADEYKWMQQAVVP